MDRRPAAKAAPSAIIGRFLWPDGSPVDAEVGLPDAVHTVRTDDHGAFETAVSTIEPGRLDISVRPACWFTARTVTTRVNVGDELAECETVTLPDEVELGIRMAVDAAFARELSRAGIGSIRLVAFDAQGSPIAPSLGRLDIVLDPGETRHVMRVQAVASVRVVCALEFQHRSSGGSQQMPGDWILPISRQATQSLEVRLDMDHVLSGVVVDHLGRPVAGAQVRLARPHPLIPGRKIETTVPASHDGRFVFIGSPGATEQVYAIVAGKKSRSEALKVGADAGRLTVDLSGQLQLRLVDGDVPVTEFDCGPRTRLFGRQQEPDLTKRPGGLCWVSTDESALWLAWRGSSGVEEQRVLAPKLEEDATWTVDVSRLPRGYSGRLEIARDVEEMPRYYVGIELVEPADLLPVGGRTAGILESREHVFLGLPPGRYSLTIEERGAPPRRLLGAMELEMAGGTKIVSLRELTAK